MNRDPSESMSEPVSPSTSRRQFLKTSAAATVGSVLAANVSLSQRAFSANSDTLRIGLIGCGGRGTGAAHQALNADKNVVLTAMADVFEHQLQGSLKTLKGEIGDKVTVDPAHCFIGLDAYQKVIDSGVDLVILATPPGFRPQHLQAVMASVEQAKKKNLALVAGFCWRYDYPRRALFERIHDGAIGDLRAIYATYYTTPVKPMPPASARKPEMTDLEWQLRNWYNFVWLCGDSLVEQAVHSVDKVAWAMKDVPPLKAVAVGGRQIPAHGGNIFDHFEVNYEYADGVRAFVGCRQQTNCYSENKDYLMGSRGLANIGGRRYPVEISGEQAWHYEGPKPDMYQVEHDELFASIRAGKPINDGDRMCTSTLMAIMGRMAAYTGQEVSWEMALKSQERLVPEKLDWHMTLEAPPLALPGITPFA